MMKLQEARDPLLATAKIAMLLVRIGLVAAMVGLVAACVVTVASGGIRPEWVRPAIDRERLPEIGGAALLVGVLALASLGLAYAFVARLARIVDTVGGGDPFTAANAERLQRMAWIALAIQLLGLPLMLLSVWLEPIVSTDRFGIDPDPSLDGFALALVLFILARVFRRGAEMRTELDGTV